MSATLYLAALVAVSTAAGAGAGALAENATSSAGDTCTLLPAEGPWSAALEDWVTADRVTLTRHGRIMALPPSQGYYVSDRIDLVPPPPPPHGPHHGPQYGPHGMLHRGPYPAHGAHHPPHESQHASADRGPDSPPPGSHYPPADSPVRQQSAPPANAPSQSGGAAPMPYDEWHVTPPPPPGTGAGAGKIVNRPTNPYKDQFKPSYPPPSPPLQQIPVHGLSDRVDEARPPPPHKQVSETDLYLLGAIEKLVYRVDFMEKRLRKMEENMHYLVVGADPKPEPCKSNFTRLGTRCYHVSSEALNWKNANYACRKLKGHLLELDDEEKRALTAGLLADKNLKGADYWTGGLNPGLLWIWSHSAAAVGNTTADPQHSTTIVGEGRCLALVHDPAVNTYVYRGQDCALRHRYVCEKNEDKSKLGNEIARVARARTLQRTHKMEWRDDDSGAYTI